jgi:PKD repeat protein
MMTVSSPTVVSPNVSVSPGTSICAGQAITFTELNNYPPATATYQWNVNGNAVTGATSNIFTTTTLNNGDQVTVTITPGCGTAVTSNPIAITVTPNTTASVSISANPGTTICQGTSVTFTATPTNGGASPSYSWTVNGNAVGTNSPTYTTNTLQNGDVVQVTMQSSIPCTNSATSQVTMTVNTPLPVSVNISASTGTNICAGQSVTFTATPTNGGANPTYQWQLNGNNIPGATGSTYTTTTLNNNDVINVVMTSSLSCVSGNPAFSNNIQFTVNTPVTPGVVISANPSTPVCQGTNITFTATPSNVINPPSYQWYINGNPVSGATSSTFSTTSLNNGDVVTVELTSNDACVTQSTVTSNAINAQINSPLPVSVNVTASNNSVCAGTNVQFTANVNNGGTPTYQWQVNGVNQGTNSPIFDYVPSNGDVITVIVTSSLSCVSNNPATSNAITMTVNPNPTVSCSGTNATFGNPNTFTATATGAAPITYVFDFGDGNQITTNNSSVNHTYSTTGSFNYVVTITDGNGCTASCNGSVNVTNPPIPVANFTTQNNIWAGCSPLTINFVNTSQNANTWEWNFGDGSPNSNALNPTHTFVNPGVYNMYLAVQNNFGLDTAFATIIVYPNPTAGIKVLTVNPNIFEPTQFQDNSTGASAWEWDFGDPASGANNFSTDQNPSHQYTSGGTYTVKLVVTNAFGCKDSITKQVSISTVSIEQPAEINDLVVYPNPFSDKLEIRFHSTSTEQVQLIIYDGIGKQVSDIQHNTVIGDNHIIWNVEEFALGVYHLVIHQGEKMSSLRLVRTR